MSNRNSLRTETLTTRTLNLLILRGSVKMFSKAKAKNDKQNRKAPETKNVSNPISLDEDEDPCAQKEPGEQTMTVRIPGLDPR